MPPADDHERLRRLVETGIQITSELSLDAVLRRLVDAAAELTGARYAALGVIDHAGHALERFVTTGMDAATVEAIGEPPRARGILGALTPLAVPLMNRGEISMTGLVIALAISATVVDSSPFSTAGALAVASADDDERPRVYRGLLIWGAAMVVTAPLLTWLIFIVAAG